MFKLMIVGALVAMVSGQAVLRIKPLVLGDTQPGQVQVILLSPLGNLDGAQLQPVARVIPSNEAQFQLATPGASGSFEPALFTTNPSSVSFFSPGEASPSGAFHLSAGMPSTSFFGSPVPMRRSSLASHLSTEVEEKPKPFAYQWESQDELGAKQTRQESADGSGRVTGSYSFTDASGLSRLVSYFADHTGFHANVNTNEPGTLTSNPAGVVINSSAQ